MANKTGTSKTLTLVAIGLLLLGIGLSAGTGPVSPKLSELAKSLGITLPGTPAGSDDDDQNHTVQFEAFYYNGAGHFVRPRQATVQATINGAPVKGTWLPEGTQIEGVSSHWDTWQSIEVKNVPKGFKLQVTFSTGLSAIKGTGCAIKVDGTRRAGPVFHRETDNITCGPIAAGSN